MASRRVTLFDFSSHGPWPEDGNTSVAETAQVLALLAAHLGAKVVCESGSYKGCTAAVIAQAIPEGTVYTCDPVVDPTPLFDRLQVAVRYFAMDFDEMLQHVPPEIDLAYIDSEGWEKRRRHFASVQPRMRQGGIVAIDDCATGGEWFIERASLYLPRCRGLVLWQKP